MLLGLLRGEPALVDEALHEGLVERQLLHVAVTQQVGPRVSDLCDADPVLVPQHGGEGRTHALELLAALDGDAQAFIRRDDTAPQHRVEVGPGSDSSSGRSAATTVLLAISPAACPPMPSATASRRGPT